jgi:hypothetical protein
MHLGALRSDRDYPVRPISESQGGGRFSFSSPRIHRYWPGSRAERARTFRARVLLANRRNARQIDAGGVP